MGHLQNYQLVEADLLPDFHLKISGLIGEGWEVFGSPQVVLHTHTTEYGYVYSDTSFYQAMVLLKKEKETEKP